MDIPKFTSNQAQNQVLRMLAYTVLISREILLLIVGSYEYLSKVLRALRTAGLITLSNTRPQLVRLTAAGVALIEAKDEKLAAHYKRLSANHHPGGTAAHRERYLKAAEVIVRLSLLGVAVGPKPTPYEVLASKEKLPKRFMALYQNKEIVQGAGAKTLSKSRSVGVLFTPAFHAVVYVLKPDVLVYKRIEYSTHLLANRTLAELYGLCEDRKSAATLLVSDDDLALARRLREPEKYGEMQSITRAAWDSSFTGGSVLYLPADAKLRQYFCHAMNTPPQEFAEKLFNYSARSEGRIRGYDAICAGCGCYEFLSFNVSKLAQAKKSPDISKIRVICWPGQEAFVSEFLELSAEEEKVVLIKYDSEL